MLSSFWFYFLALFLFGGFLGLAMGALLLRLFEYSGYKRIVTILTWLTGSSVVIGGGVTYLERLVSRQASAVSDPERVWEAFIFQVASYLGGFGLMGIWAAWPIVRSPDRELLEVFAPIRLDLSQKQIRAVYLCMVKRMSVEKAARKMRTNREKYLDLLTTGLASIHQFFADSIDAQA